MFWKNSSTDIGLPSDFYSRPGMTWVEGRKSVEVRMVPRKRLSEKNLDTSFYKD